MKSLSGTRVSSVLFLLAVAVVCFAQPAEAVEPPKPPAGHPRLLIRPQDVPRLRNRFGCPEMAHVKQALLRQSRAVAGPRSSSGKPNRTIRRAYEANAFLYLINRDERAGRKAVETALQYLKSLTATYRKDGLFVSRELNRSIFGAAMVYDWCYPLLSGRQRMEMIRQIKRIAGNTEYGWPVKGPGFVSGHYGEEKHPCMLGVGIAVYDEEPSIYNTMADHLYNGFAPVRNFFYRGHKHHQGSAYGIGRFASELTASLLITRMGLPNPCISDQAKVPYFFMYNRTPDGLFIPEGDDYYRRAGPNRFHSAELLFIIASMYQDPYVLDEALRYGKEPGDAALRMLIQDESLQAKPVSKLPLTTYFGSPFGQMIARTGWDIQRGPDAPTAVARMNIGEYMFGNHAHLDAGHFCLYYKGHLAIDSGIYEGKYGYGSEHFKNYYQRTVAHNSLLILDPHEPKPRWWGREVQARDGGQFWPDGQRSEFKNLQHLLAKGKRAQILAHAFGPDPVEPEYSYLKGDIAPAYRAPEPYPPKVSEVIRSFVFLNLKNRTYPAALIVYDKVTSTQPSFRKIWLLHSINEPKIEAGTITITRTEKGYNGRLVDHVLLPRISNQRITKIGGPGKEFWVDGRNYPNPIDRPGYTEPGSWRIELSPRLPAKTDHFLNVMYVSDALPEPERLNPSRLESDQLLGVKIADRVVFFSKTAHRLAQDLTFTVEGSKAILKYLVTDIEPGTWQLTGPLELTLQAAGDAAVLYFEGPAGTYKLHKL